MKWIAWILAIILFIVIVGFTLLNSTEVLVNGFVFQFKASIGFVLTLFFIVGSLLGLIIGFISAKWKIFRK